MPNVVILGEAVIDLFATQSLKLSNQARYFMAAPGGAPANVAVGLARMDVSVGFIGKVGDDSFGDLLVQTLKGEGVDTKYFLRADSIPTTLAIVNTRGVNEQEFVIYRMADAQLRSDELDSAYITSARIFLYGSVTLSDASKATAIQAATWAERSNIFVAFDANLRPVLWPNLKVAKTAIMNSLHGASLCKLNENEMEFLTGTKDLSKGSRWILKKGPRLCVVTLGSQGCYFNNGHYEGYIPGYKVSVVDTTGCGDAFFAGLVSGLLETSLEVDVYDEETLNQLMRFANAVGALTATKVGAMTALPTRKQVDKFLHKQ